MAHESTAHQGNSSNGALLFIVGGLVVAVGVLAYLMLGGDIAPGTATDGGVNVTVDSSETASITASTDAADGDGEAAASAAASATTEGE